MSFPNLPGLDRSWRRVDGVDLLRALAIVFVWLSHVRIRLVLAKVAFTAGWPHQASAALFGNGTSGVHIFFAISGFLITATTLRRWRNLKSVSIKAFYRLRFARIAPLFLTLLAVLSMLHAAGVTIFVVQPKTGGLSRALLAALTLHVNVLEAHRGYLPPSWDILWSLSVEETFYLFFPLICRVFGQGKLLIGLLIVFVAIGPIARTVWAHGNPTWQEYTYLGGIDAIALGCLTALLVERYVFSRSTLRILGIAGVLLLLYCLGFSIHAYAWGLDRSGLYMSVVALATCMIVVAAAQSAWQCPCVLGSFLTVGQHSYEIYLTHEFVVLALFHTFLVLGKPTWAILPLFIGTIVVSALFGELVARFYSEPMNRWLRRIWDEGPDKLGSVIDAENQNRTAEPVLA